MLRRILAVGALVLVTASAAEAQAYFYPALQPARIAEREYNFVLADGGDAGTALVFQWREGLGNPKLQLTFDAGFADPDNADTRLILGGGLAYQLTRSSSEMPFDIALAGGLGFSNGDELTIVRLPFGAVVGHRFDLEGGYAISPFVHPRLSWNRVSANGFSDSDTELELDIGANLELKSNMAVRLAAVLGDADAIAVSFAWTPRGLRK
ncbi:MAG: hypothetical protein ACKVS7_10495 [Gemmatimonadaceae bacterium]